MLLISFLYNKLPPGFKWALSGLQQGVKYALSRNLLFAVLKRTNKLLLFLAIVVCEREG